MSDDSDYSFEYDDSDALSESSVAEIAETASQTPLDSEKDHTSGQNSAKSVQIERRQPQSDTSEKTRSLKSSNLLSNMCYRPQSVSHYVYENMVHPGEVLQRDFFPNFALEDVVLMLHYKKWSADEVTSGYFEDWPRLRDGCGLAESRDQPLNISSRPSFMCPICCESGNLRIFALSCGHEFCTFCYKQYISSNLAKGAIIRCMDLKCNFSLPYSAVNTLLAVEIPEEDTPQESENVAAKKSGSNGTADRDAEYSSEEETENHGLDEYGLEFEKNGISEYVVDALGSEQPLVKNPLLISAARVSIDASRSRFRWCPAVDCSQLVECVSGTNANQASSAVSETPQNNDLAQIAMVTCANNHEFCFDCHYENHLPCPCWLAKAWITRCEDDTETVNWIDANTQSCPKCQAIIEKNGGCNHMTCETCRHHFCWICLGDWTMHGQNYYMCNRFDPKEVEEVKKKQTHKQNTLGRYLHFYRRFTVHQVSIKGDQNTLLLVQRCMLQYMRAQTSSSERTGSWNDVQFLTDAIRSLTRGRKTLMWTYAFAFYLTKSNFSEIFEGMQDYLNKTVEDLSRLFEEIKIMDSPEKTAAKITRRKAEIISLASLVSRRRDLLIESARTGLDEGSLQFFSP